MTSGGYASRGRLRGGRYGCSCTRRTGSGGERPRTSGEDKRAGPCKSCFESIKRSARRAGKEQTHLPQSGRAPQVTHACAAARFRARVSRAFSTRARRASSERFTTRRSGDVIRKRTSSSPERRRIRRTPFAAAALFRARITRRGVSPAVNGNFTTWPCLYSERNALYWLRSSTTVVTSAFLKSGTLQSSDFVLSRR